MDVFLLEWIVQVSVEWFIVYVWFVFGYSVFYCDFYFVYGIMDDDLWDFVVFVLLLIVDKVMLCENFECICIDEVDLWMSVVFWIGGSIGLLLYLLCDLWFFVCVLEWCFFDWWGVKFWDDCGIVMWYVLIGVVWICYDFGWFLF